LVHSNNQNTVYLETPFYLKDGHGATSVLQSNSLNEISALYFITTIKKAISNLSYQEKATKIVLKNTFISLPTNKTGELDFEYMENYIQKNINENLEKMNYFLKKNNLLYATLSSSEKKAIEDFTRKKIKFIDFKIIDVFNIYNSHNILKTDVVFDSGATPYVTASEINNSVVSYINYDESLIEEGNSIMIGGKSLVITYQSKDFYSNDSHNLILYLNEKERRTENIQLFLVSSLYRSLKPKYSWGDSISFTKIQKDTVFLPVTDANEIDYEFMENYISAQKKLAVLPILDNQNSEYQYSTDYGLMEVAEKKEYK